MNYTVNPDQKFQWHKKLNGDVYVGQWDQNHEGWMVRLEDALYGLPEDLQQRIKEQIK